MIYWYISNNILAIIIGINMAYIILKLAYAARFKIHILFYSCQTKFLYKYDRLKIKLIKANTCIQ